MFAEHTPRTGTRRAPRTCARPPIPASLRSPVARSASCCSQIAVLRRRAAFRRLPTNSIVRTRPTVLSKLRQRQSKIASLSSRFVDLAERAVQLAHQGAGARDPLCPAIARSRRRVRRQTFVMRATGTDPTRTPRGSPIRQRVGGVADGASARSTTRSGRSASCSTIWDTSLEIRTGSSPVPIRSPRTQC